MFVMTLVFSPKFIFLPYNFMRRRRIFENAEVAQETVKESVHRCHHSACERERERRRRTRVSVYEFSNKV